MFIYYDLCYVFLKTVCIPLKYKLSEVTYFITNASEIPNKIQGGVVVPEFLSTRGVRPLWNQLLLHLPLLSVLFLLLKNDAMYLYIVQKFVNNKIVKDVKISTLHDVYATQTNGTYVHVNKMASNESLHHIFLWKHVEHNHFIMILRHYFSAQMY